MRIPDLQFRHLRGIFIRHEPIQETLDDCKRFRGFDVLGLLLLDEAVESLHDVLGIIRIEVAITAIIGNIVLALKTMDSALLQPDLILLLRYAFKLISLREICLRLGI